MGTTAADMQKLFGRAILFIFRCQGWTPAQFAEAARFARGLGFDTISPKRGEGTQGWCTVEDIKAERAAVLAAGVGYAPFWYCDTIGETLADKTAFVIDQCKCLQEYGAANDGIIIADMETEWDGQVDLAHVFEAQMRPWAGVLGVTTWADPPYQDWTSVAQALAPCVNLWIPQRYDNWLAVQPLPAEMTIVQPAIDLSTEFGSNNAVGIAQSSARQNLSVWVWEYVYAQDDQPLARQICTIVHAETGTAHIEDSPAAAASSVAAAPAIESGTPPADPAPAPEATQYTVCSGDLPAGLAGIAARFGVSLDALQAANSGHTPDQIYSNMVLNIPAGASEG